MKQTNFINYTIGATSIHFKLTPSIIFGFLSLILLLIVSAFIIGTQFNNQHDSLAQTEFPEIDTTLTQQNNAIHRAKIEAEKSIEILSSKLGTLQLHVLRLNTLGEHLTHVYNINEIDFSNDDIAMSNTLNNQQASTNVIDFINELEKLERIINKNNEQLTALSTLLSNKTLSDNSHPSIMPIKAYVSSWFGWRSDPMKKHKRKSFHQGLDFSADVGTSINSVADGIVSWSGPKDRYGNFIEIDHGNGYVTRYGHINELYVRVGQRVRKGQQIASVGMTGRATGPHLHFEIQKNGQHLDPKNFMNLN